MSRTQHPRELLQLLGTWLAAALSALLLVAWNPAQADDRATPGHVSSPYFHVRSNDPSTDRLPLKATRVDVRIAGVIADVTVTQTYRNEGQRPLEAVYVFPGSTRAAVHAMTVRLGDRLLTARIKEKQQARIEYDTAKSEGRTAALLEQERPNVFQMNVANILPGDDVKVELRYTELLVPTEARYQFVFPTVLGPRYNSPQSQSARAGWVQAPFLRAGEAPSSAFELNVQMASPLPVRELRSPSHAIEVEGLGGREPRVVLAASPAGTVPHNRDFILDYRLAGERIESGLTLYQAGDENFFLAMVEPPVNVPVQAISPREYLFVVDISGSMHGFPLNTAKELLRNLIGGLRPSDSFNVLLFAGSSRMLAPQSVPATRPNIEQALRTLDETGGGGSTEIVPALRRIVNLPKSPDLSRTVVVVTDGYVTVEREVFELVRRNLHNANLFAFGIGSSVNRHLIEGLARAGQGEAFVVTQPEEARAQAERLRRIIEAPVLTQVTARFEGLDVYDLSPSHLPDVMAGRPVVIHGKWRGQAGEGRLVIEGRSAAGPWRAELPLPRPDAAAVALRQLWARERIAQLSDQEALEGGQARKDEITALGLRYNLLTQYTSFIAVDRVVRNIQPQDTTTVNQPSPLPQGVSELAIGAEVPSTPEPGVWAALALCGVVLLGVARRQRRAQ